VNEEPELDLFSAHPAVILDAGRLGELLAVLREAKGWMTRRKLEVLGFDERELRELGELDTESEIFSYPGSPGYKLFEYVEEREFDRAISLKTQSRKMLRKWLRFQRRWHRRAA
jgi:hypothetical protein